MTTALFRDLRPPMSPGSVVVSNGIPAARALVVGVGVDGMATRPHRATDAIALVAIDEILVSTLTPAPTRAVARRPGRTHSSPAVTAAGLPRIDFLTLADLVVSPAPEGGSPLSHTAAAVAANTPAATGAVVAAWCVVVIAPLRRAGVLFVRRERKGGTKCGASREDRGVIKNTPRHRR